MVIQQREKKMKKKINFQDSSNSNKGLFNIEKDKEIRNKNKSKKTQ